MRVIFVEDHAELAEAIAGGLRRAGFVVDVASTLADARQTMSSAQYDLAVVDLGLPDGSGLDLLRDRQQRGVGPPVIMLTARGALGDRVEGLDEGADDYIVKPVEIPELVARCRAVLRRPGNRAGRLLEAGHVTLDVTLREASCRGTPLALGRREIGALEALLQRRNRVLPRSVLLEQLYDRDSDVSLNAVDATVSRLRRVLESADAGVVLRTVRGLGWMLTTEAE
jgi:two-component system OmpR family response regulator